MIRRITASWRLPVLALCLIATGVALQTQQYVTWGHWWDADQIHHETFTIALVLSGALLLLISRFFTLKVRRQ